MKQGSGSKYSKYSSGSLLANKPIEQTRLESEIILLKNKLRSNRNIETRKKLQYRIGVVEQDIAEFKNRQAREKDLSKQTAEQLEKEVSQSKTNCGNLQAKAKALREQQENLKADVAEKMNANKQLNTKVTALEKNRRDKIDQVSKLERVQRLQTEEVKQTEFLKEKYTIELETIHKKIENYSEKFQKMKEVNREWQSKVNGLEATLNQENQKMKALFKSANNAIIEQEKSMHRNIKIKDEHRELEHIFRDSQRKYQQILELFDIEQERNQMISERTKQINQLIEGIDIPNLLDDEVQKENSNLTKLQQRLSCIQEANKKKQKTNEDVIKKLQSLCANEEPIRNYLFRNQTVRELEAKCKIDMYVRMASSQSRAVYDSHRKQPSLNNTGYIPSLGASGFISNSAQKSSSRLIDRYMI